jgi:hypothetical protein
MQAACNRARWAHLSDFQRAQLGGPGPRVMQLVRRLLRVSNCTTTHATTTPPRLRNQYRDSRRPSARPCNASQARRSNVVKIGPAATAGRSSGHIVSQAYVPSGGSERTLSHSVKTTRPCSVPRTARARAMAASRTTRPVALTPRRDRRRLWQEKRATLSLRHNDRVKKGTPRRSISYPFPFFLFLSLATGTGKGDTPERILPCEGTRLRASLLIRGSKAGPSEGFNSRLRARGLHTHYWSEVQRPAPRKGSTAASGYSGSAPTTDQGFEGWPPKGSQPPQTQSEG